MHPAFLASAKTVQHAVSGLPTPVAAAICIIGGTMSIAVMDAVVKYLSVSLAITQIAWVRFVVQGAALAMIAMIAHPATTRRILVTRRPMLQAFRAICILGSTLAFFAAIRHISLAQANAIAFAAPFMITAMSAFILGERVGWRRWAAVAVGFIGVVIVIRPGVEAFHWALALPLVMAVLSAAYHVTTPILARTENPANSLYYAAGLGIVVLGFVMPTVWITPSGLEAALLGAVGLLGVLGHFLLILGFRAAQASLLSAFLYLHLVWAILLGLVAFGDYPDAATLIGAGIIVASGIYVLSRERRAKAAHDRS